MNTPTLPAFSRTRNQPKPQRTHAATTQQLRRQQRRVDFLLFLYSCALIAFLVHLAVS